MSYCLSCNVQQRSRLDLLEIISGAGMYYCIVALLINYLFTLKCVVLILLCLYNQILKPPGNQTSFYENEQSFNTILNFQKSFYLIAYCFHHHRTSFIMGWISLCEGISFLNIGKRYIYCVYYVLCILLSNIINTDVSLFVSLPTYVLRFCDRTTQTTIEKFIEKDRNTFHLEPYIT